MIVILDQVFFEFVEADWQIVAQFLEQTLKA